MLNKRKTFSFGCLVLSVTVLTFGSCKSVDFEKSTAIEQEKYTDDIIDSYVDELQLNANEYERYLYEEKLNDVDMEKTIVYVDRPVYVPADETPEKIPTGKDAVKKSTEGAIVSPKKYVRGAMYYDFDEDFTYEIYCQAYRTTDIVLEPGEQVLEMPFLSENQVWEIGAGVSRQGNKDVQHFFLKPSYSGLTTSMIIITDKRIYHLMLKSFKDAYMSIVKWNYPSSMPMTIKSDAMYAASNGSRQTIDGKIMSDEGDFVYPSFDYKMRYSLYKKPIWLPTMVYDDGRRTYIRMNETVLNREAPVLFNKKNEVINYRVKGNTIIIDNLIEKVTLMRKNQKVVITKKKYKEPPKVKEEDEVQDITPNTKRGLTITSEQAEYLRKRNIPEKKTEATETTTTIPNTTTVVPETTKTGK